MSIEKIKELSSSLKAGKLLSSVVSNPIFGNTNVRVELEQLFDLIDAYKEPNPKVDTPPKPKTTRRTRTTKKENVTE